MQLKITIVAFYKEFLPHALHCPCFLFTQRDVILLSCWYFFSHWTQRKTLWMFPAVQPQLTA